MKVVFIRHADAEPVDSGPDADRRLTKLGRRQSATTAEALKAMDLALEAVFTSPLARAAETAEIVAGVHGAPVETAEELAPPGDAKALRGRLEKLARRGVGMVGLFGHTPSLEQLLAALITGGAPAAMSLTKAGAACVDFPDDGSGLATLVWLMTREQLATIAEAGGE